MSLVALVVAAGCGDDDEDAGPSATSAGASSATASGGGDRPSIVVTTNVLGDVVSEVAGDVADVEVIMPLGSDPHDFAPSARQAEAMAEADLLVTNGAGFEEGMLGVIESAEESGAPVFAFADHIELIEFTGEHEEHADEEAHADEEEHAEDEHADEGEEHADDGAAADEEHAEDDEHAEDEDGAGSDDPHIWTDPSRMATAVGALGERMADLEGVDAEALQANVDEYVATLEELDSEIVDELAPIADDRRTLVTNHEVFGYFADRYDFNVLGAVVPSLTTNAEASAADLTELADVIREAGVPAIFAETTQSSQLADALADEVGGDVEVVELYTESLGEDGSGAETYVGMMRTNAELITGALA